MRRVLADIDAHIDASGLTAEVLDPEPQPAISITAQPDRLDLRGRGITSVIWATGHRRTYPWLHLPVLDASGEIRQRRGVTPHPACTCSGSASSTTAAPTSSTASAVTPPSSPPTSSAAPRPTQPTLKRRPAHAQRPSPLRRRRRRRPRRRRRHRDAARPRRPDASWSSTAAATAPTPCPPTPSCAAASCSCTAGGSSTASSTPAPRPSGARPSATPTTRSPSPSNPHTASTRSTPRAAPCSTRSSSTPRSLPAPTSATASPSPTSAATRSGRVTGIEGRDDAGRPSSPSTPTSSSAPTVCAPPSPSGSAPRSSTAATAAGAVVYGYWSGVDTDGYEWVYRPGAAAGLIPTNDGLTCVFAGSTPARIGRGGRAVLEAVVRRASPSVADRIAAGTAPAGVRSFAGHPGYLRRAWGPGWALVGDAGYWKDPISAHGLTDALRDAELLARAIVSSVSGDVARGRRLRRLPGHPRPPVVAIAHDRRRHRRVPTGTRRQIGLAPAPSQLGHGRRGRRHRRVRTGHRAVTTGAALGLGDLGPRRIWDVVEVVRRSARSQVVTPGAALGRRWRCLPGRRCRAGW